MVYAQTFRQEQTNTVNGAHSVVELVDELETPFGLELLATVHLVVSRLQAFSLDEVTARVYGWNDRKRQFTPRQIALAVSMLSKKGWIPSLAGSA